MTAVARPFFIPSIASVTDVLKGRDLKVGDTISICANSSLLDTTSHNATLLLFLEGKDGDTWVPSWGYFGVIPQNKDGRFTLEWVSTNRVDVTGSQLKAMLR